MKIKALIAATPSRRNTSGFFCPPSGRGDSKGARKILWGGEKNKCNTFFFFATDHINEIKKFSFELNSQRLKNWCWVCVNLHYTEFKTIAEKPPVQQLFTVFAGYPSLIVGADYGTKLVAGVNGSDPP